MALPAPRPQSNYQKCREAYVQCNGDQNATIAQLLAWSAEDDDLHDYLLKGGADQAVRLLFSHERHSRIRGTLRVVEADDETDSDELLTFTPPEGTEGLYRLAASNLRSLMEYPLAGGQRMKDATRDDLLRNAEKMYQQAHEMQIRGRWFHSIAERLKRDKRVGDVLTDDDLKSLLERASNV